MFDMDKNRNLIDIKNARKLQDIVDDVGKGYENVINDYAQIDGMPLNRFTYSRGWFESPDDCIVIFRAEEEMIPEEVMILGEALSIIGRCADTNIRTIFISPFEIQLIASAIE